MYIERIELPYPPSVNHYWYRRGARTFISRKGKDFRKEVVERCKGCTPYVHRVALTVFVHPPDRRRRDIDNVLKSLLDALESACVFVNDSQVDMLNVQRGNVVKGGVAIVELECLGEDFKHFVYDPNANKTVTYKRK